MSKSFADDFVKSFDELTLPMELSVRFDVMERLAENDCGETYLLTEKDSNKLFVLKCNKKSEIAKEIGEAALLRGLQHKGLPNFEAELETEDTLFVLRDYVEGIPLDQYLAERGTIDDGQAVHIIMELCGILSYLHSQPDPIIHRDIKPSNIIIDLNDNSIALIDFGISRKYSENADTDTVYLGTKKFAPPEQYGFSQTDCRTDIYALGVVLRYMLTGTTDGAVADKGLERIIGKCSAFAPKDRFQNAEAVTKALMKYHRHTRQITARIIASTLLLCAAIAVGFVVGRYTEFLSFPAADDGIFIFSDPMVEKAVRVVLGKADGEAVYRDELNAVTRLYFVGENVTASKDEYFLLNEPFWTNTPPPYGKLENLNDLPLMENLREVSIFGQTLSDLSPLKSCFKLAQVDILFCYNISDISPLAACSKLSTIVIMRGIISDVSPLAELPALQALDILDIPLSDFSSLESMKALRRLQIGQMKVRNIAELGDVFQLESLNLHNSWELYSLDGIERYENLVSLSISGAPIKDFSPLNTLPALKELIISTDMQQYLGTLLRDDIQITLRD